MGKALKPASETVPGEPLEAAAAGVGPAVLCRWFAVECAVIHNGETLAASDPALLSEAEFDALRRASAIAADATWQDGEAEFEI